MSEIRDFLAPMTVPDLSSSDFVNEFNDFCTAVQDNINKIISAPFLKGDRGSKTSIIKEPLKMMVDQNGDPVEEDGTLVWTDFAKSIARAIYNDPDGLPLIDDDVTGARLVEPGDDSWERMCLIDGGPISTAEIGYEINIYTDNTGTDLAGTGKMKILSGSNSQSTILIVEAPDVPVLEMNEYIIGTDQDDPYFHDNFFQLSDAGGVVYNYWIQIGSEINLHGDDPEDFEIFRSYDIFKDLEYIPVCYDEASGMKSLCVPFYFFDGRLNYVGYMDNLSMFCDMSCAVFGNAELVIPEGHDHPAKEDLENPNSWQWNMEVSNALPKLYYNTELEQFCWEVSGEKTNIIAQGLKGDKGDPTNIWVCGGEAIDERIKITRIIAPGDPDVRNIQSGDLAIVSYAVDSEGQPDPYYRIQFGTAHISGNDRYIDLDEDSELIQRLRNYSLHDYLMSIGPNPEGHYPDNSPITALYTLERTGRANAMAMWAGKGDGQGDANNDKQHYIAPVRKSKTDGSDWNTEAATLTDRALNILYNTVRIKNILEVNNIRASNGLTTSAVSVIGSNYNDYLEEYRLGALCNVIGTWKSDSPVAGRFGTNAARTGRIDENDEYRIINGGEYSSASLLYMECDLTIGWIPTVVANKITESMVSNFNNPTLSIYRAQKYHIYVKIPVIGSTGMSAKISLNGREWVDSISLSNALGHKGSGSWFTINIDPNMRFREKTEVMAWINIGMWETENFPWRMTEYREHLSDNPNDYYYEFYYDYKSTDEHFIKDRVKWTRMLINATDSIRWYLNQYAISGGSLSIQSGTASGSPRIENLFWFGGRGDKENTLYPLINDKYSFLGYFKTLSNNRYVTTTNNVGGYMWQGRVLSATGENAQQSSITNPKLQDLFYLNTTMYETLYPRDFNVFVIKNAANLSEDALHTSPVPANTEIHIYPEGMCGVGYDLVFSPNAAAWGQIAVGPSASQAIPFGPGDIISEP